MDQLSWHMVWKSALIVGSGVLLLRLSGRKSISQMTVATTVIMISIGSMLAQGIVDRSVWRSIISVSLFLVYLVLMEKLELLFQPIERLLSGRPIEVVRNGVLDIKKLKLLRMTQSQFEMRIRQKGIQRISDLKHATVEINGELGYELKREAQPLTIGEFEKLMAQWRISPADGNDQPFDGNYAISQEACPNETHP
jgi:uncharacterized membrane protein YcaP (DUF421 family)